MKTSSPANAIRRFLELQAAGGILLLAASGVALHNRLDDVLEMVSRLVATCNACHSSFRILLMVTEPGRNVDDH